MPAPIPQLIAPLTWRRPALVWTPFALAVAIGWPAAVFYDDAPLQRFVVVAGLMVFAIALTTLGFRWAIWKAPKTRATVIGHVVLAGGSAALASPFILTGLLGAVAQAGDAERARFSAEMAYSMIPLALFLGLPISLLSGMLFAWLALKRGDIRQSGELVDVHQDVQPFR